SSPDARARRHGEPKGTHGHLDGHGFRIFAGSSPPAGHRCRSIAFRATPPCSVSTQGSRDAVGSPREDGMKHRGRHRRRRRGRALRAALAGTALALTAAATLISTSQATVADDPGALEPVTSSAATAPLRLTERSVPQEDRKSTRLNSSHVKISYAVFCL